VTANRPVNMSDTMYVVSLVTKGAAHTSHHGNIEASPSRTSLKQLPSWPSGEHEVLLATMHS
jgi:hypothetical protein